MAWICDKTGQQKCEIKKLSYNGVFMDVSSITVTVESAVPIAFAIGDYIDWDYDGLRYTLDAAAGVEKQARKQTIGNAFVYDNLVFLSPLKAADNAEFLDVIIGNTNEFLTNTEFSFYGTAWDYAKRLEANLCRMYGDGSWKVRIWTGGTCYDETPATGINTGSWENKLVDVSGIKCLGGFQQIYDLWGCAYVFSVNNGVNYVDFYDDFEQYAQAWKESGVDKIFAYGKGNGLYKIRHTQDTDHVLVTRLRPYGSSDNLPANYYLNSPDYHVDGNESSELAISRLMLPASQWTKNGVKQPANAYLEQNTDLYGVREASVCWDGSDPELGEIKPTIYNLTIQDLLDLMASGTTYRPNTTKWPDTSQRIDKIITGAAPADNGAVAEAGYDFTVVESNGALSAHEFGVMRVNKVVDFSDLVMGSTPSISHLAEFRIVPTSSNTVAVSFDVPDTVVSAISLVTAYLTPYVGNEKVSDATFPCAVSHEEISVTEDGVHYTRRYKIRLLDSAENPIVFSTMLTGQVTFRIYAEINFISGREPDASIPVIRAEYAVAFNLLRGNKAIDKFFSVTIPQVGFDLAAAVTSGARLCMRSGANQPREFQIVPSSVRYIESSDTWYFRCKRSLDQSISTYFPNSDSVIAAGDEFYFSGIAMPALYVEIAAQKLLTAATAWLALHSKPRMLSSVDVDNKIMAKESIVLKEGMSLPLSDTDLGITPQNQESRIIDNIRIEEGSDSIRTFSITLRDKKEKSSLDQAIRGATSNFATNTSVAEAIGAVDNRDHGSLSGRDMPNQHPISSITGLEEALASLAFFEKDGNGNIKLKDEYGGLWANGFVSAGGLSSSSGAQGVSLEEVWTSLMGNEDDYANDTIDAHHIPLGNGLSINPQTGRIDAVVGAGTLSSLEDVTLGTLANGDLLSYDSTAGKWVNASSTPLTDALKSLQSQVDAVATRNNYDELLATSLFADVAAITSLYANTISLGGNDLATTLTSLTGRMLAVEGYFDSNGNAKAALKLTTVSQTAWGRTYWTAGGVPTSISGNIENAGHVTPSATNTYDLGSASLAWRRIYLADGVYLYYNSAVQAVKLEGAGFYTDSFISAGGLSSGGGGGGGGVDLEAVWDSLEENDPDVTGYNELIHTAHIPDMASIYGYVKGTDITDMATKTWVASQGYVSSSDLSALSARVTTLEGDEATVSLILESLQAQIDSLALRDNYDELTATAMFADQVAAQTVYAESIELGGVDLATRISTLFGYFDTSGNAKSALKLTTVSKTAWGQTYWTSGGVPDTISGNMSNVGNISMNGSISGATTIAASTSVTSPKFYLDANTYFELDTDGYVHLVHPTGKGFYADGFISAGGVSGSGGGSGVDLEAMWENLQDNDPDVTGYNLLINTAHIPDMANVYSYVKTSAISDMATKTWVESKGYITGNQTIELTGDVTGRGATSITTAIGEGKVTNAMLAGSIAWSKLTVSANDIVGTLSTTPVNRATADAFGNTISTTYATVSRLDGDEAILSSVIESLQAQVDSVAARDCFDEVTAGAVFSDVISASNVYAGAIVLGDSDLATTLTNTSGRISTLEGYFTNGVVPVSHGGTGLSSLTSGYALVGAGTSAVSLRAITDNASATAVSASTNLITANTLYYHTGNSNISTVGTITSGTWNGSKITNTYIDKPWIKIGTTDVNLGDTITNLAGMGNITASGLIKTTNYVQATRFYLSDSIYFLVDSNGVKLEGAGFYTDSFISAGGFSSSGGAGDIDAEAMWEYLTNTADDTTYNTTPIDIAHLGAVQTWVVNQGYLSASAAASTYASITRLDSDEAIIASALKSLQSQVDSVASCDMFDELSAGALFADNLSVSSAYIGSLNIGSKTLSDTSTIVTINGTALAIGGSFSTTSITAGTAGTSSSTSGTSISIPYVTMNSYGIVTGYGTHTHSISQANIFGSSSIGSASLPVYYNGSALTACTASSVFSALSSTAGTNLSITVAGQNRTATLYATYDSDSENIASAFGTVSKALQSLQSQIDAVAARTGVGDEVKAACGLFEVLSTTSLQADSVSVAGALSVSGATTLSSTLGVTGNATFSANAKAASLTITGAATIGSTLGVTGATTLSSTLGVTGSTTLSSTLSVTGSATLNGATYVYNSFQVGTSSTNRNSIFYGALYIGSATAYLNNVSGDFHTNVGFYSDSYITAGATGSSSDARLKSGIQTISADRALSLLMRLRGCEWTWNEKKSYLAGKHGSGLVAQEVAPVMPWMVLDLNGELSLTYNSLWGIAIPVMKNHEHRIAELERENKQLKEKVKQLENRNHASQQ